MTWKAWVLSGCGARGPYQAGVMCSLCLAEPNPDLLVGCSAGALNCAGAAYLGPPNVARLWSTIKSRSDVFANRFDAWNAEFWLGKYDASPLRKIIEKVIDGEPRIPFKVLFSDLVDMKPRIADSTQVSVEFMRKAVEASASLPGIVPPVSNRFVDGGIFHVAPLKFAIDSAPEEGGDITVILGSNLNPTYGPWSPSFVTDVLMRALVGITDQIMRNDIETCLDYNLVKGKKLIRLRIIQPPADWAMDTLAFNPDEMQNAYTLGLSWKSTQKEEWLT